MTTKKATVGTYRVLKGVSCRLSNDPEGPDYERFVSWKEGDTLDPAKAPAHINLAWLLADEAIEEVTGG